MTDERMFTVPEVARFFGITPQAVRQRIVEGRLGGMQGAGEGHCSGIPHQR